MPEGGDTHIGDIWIGVLARCVVGDSSSPGSNRKDIRSDELVLRDNRLDLKESLLRRLATSSRKDDGR